jgi:hypothetical protein
LGRTGPNSPPIEPDARTLLVELEAAAIGEDAKGAIAPGLVVDHDSPELAITLAVFDEDQALTDAPELPGLEDRAARGNSLEELDELASRLVLDGSEQPAREQRCDQAEGEVGEQEGRGADTRRAHGDQLSVRGESTDGEQDADEEGEGQGVGGHHGQHAGQHGTQIARGHADEEQVVESA